MAELLTGPRAFMNSRASEQILRARSSSRVSLMAPLSRLFEPSTSFLRNYEHKTYTLLIVCTPYERKR